jgi:16S rRNA (uracil1498-N3)-methyltransferase
LGHVKTVGKHAIAFDLVERLEVREPALSVALLLSIVKFDRFEWALEKATELGVNEIIPLEAARCDKPLILAGGKRWRRWQKILVEAAQQARCLAPPNLWEARRPRDAFTAAAAPDSLLVLLSERSGAAPLRDVLSLRTAAGCKTEMPPGAPSSAALAIGPEGGWTDDEIAQAREAGFREASLGPRILRTETAVIAALAALKFALGEE